MAEESGPATAVGLLRNPVVRWVLVPCLIGGTVEWYGMTSKGSRGSDWKRRRLFMRLRKVLRPLVLLSLLAVVITGCGVLGSSQEYPSRKITFIVPYPPGGSSDPISRQYAEQLEGILGDSVVVENHGAGGTGVIGTSDVVQAEPDGYTIGIGSNLTIALPPIINEGLPYEGPEDYQPIVKLARLPLVLAVDGDAPWQTFEEFIDYAQENPGELQVSIGGGKLGTRDLQIEDLNRAADVDIQTVPFTAAGELQTAVLSGRTDALVISPPGIVGDVEAGNLRVLGTFAEQPADVFPESTPVTARYDDVRPLYDGLFVFAPKGLPEGVRNKLVDASRKIATSEEMRRFLEKNGYTPDPKGPKELAAEIKENQEIYAEIIESLEQEQ